MRLTAVIILVTSILYSQILTQEVSNFESHSDTGKVLYIGSLRYDPKTFTYQLAGSGSNIWVNNDEVIICTGEFTPKVIAYLYGGQGSINTPSWSPHSKKVALVSNSDF